MIQPAVYDNEKRYIFTNWTNEDFIGMWGGVETLVEKGKSIEVPMYKAYHFTKHLVDREMMKKGVVVLDSMEARKEFEDKTVAEITSSTDSPALAAIKEKIREEIEVEVGKKPRAKKTEEKKTEAKTEEFADIKE